MSGRFGIHMGNSTVCLSVVKDDKVDIVASKFGDRSSYAVIAAAEDDEWVVGLPAKQGTVRNGPLTVQNNYQFLNDEMTTEEFTEAVKNCVCTVNEDPLQYNLEKDDISRTITPYEIAVLLFTNLNENAAQAAKSEINLEAVIAVPLHFSAKTRKTIAAAATESGFEILQLLSEPAAALLAYDIGFNVEEKSNVLVYRLGGLTCDVTILSVRQGMYETVGHTHLRNLGGHMITKCLSDFMAQEFCNKYKLDPRESRRTMIKLLQHAEASKHILSSVPSAHVFIESLMDGVDWSQNISRARFENIIAAQLSAFVKPIEELVAKCSNVQIDKIIFCGGSMKIPKLQSTIQSLLPNAQVLNSIPTDEVIAIGCGKQCTFVQIPWDLEGEHIDMEITTLTNDLFIAVNKDEKKPTEDILLFAQGTPVPAENKTVPIKLLNGKTKVDVRQSTNVVDTFEYARDDVNTAAKEEDLEIRAKIYAAPEGKEGALINFIFPVIEERLIN